MRLKVSARGVEGSLLLQPACVALLPPDKQARKNFVCLHARLCSANSCEVSYFHKLLYLAAMPSVRSTSLSTRPSTSSTLTVPRSRASR